MRNAYIAPAARGGVSAGAEGAAVAADSLAVQAGRGRGGQAVAERHPHARSGGGGGAEASAASLEKYGIDWVEKELEKELEKEQAKYLEKEQAKYLEKEQAKYLEKEVLEDIWFYSLNEYVPKEGTYPTVRFYPWPSDRAKASRKTGIQGQM